MNQFPDLKAKDFPAEWKKNEGAVLMDCCKGTYYASKDAKTTVQGPVILSRETVDR